MYVKFHETIKFTRNYAHFKKQTFVYCWIVHKYNKCNKIILRNAQLLLTYV